MDLMIPIKKFAEAGTSEVAWVEALVPNTYVHPVFGNVEITKDKLNNFAKNFHDGVRGQEIATNYEHGADTAKGNKASGWIKDAKVDGDKLLLGINFTETARDEITKNEWKYFSLEWEDDYTHTVGGSKHKDVIVGGGLTNRPIAKGMKSLPLNFSELVEEVVATNPEEFMEPGTNNPDLTPSDDPDRRSRRGTPPPGFDGSIDDLPSTVTEASGDKNTIVDDGGGNKVLLEKLKELYNLSDDVTEEAVITHVTTEHKKFSELNKTAAELSTQKSFSEQYPEQHARMEALEAQARVDRATLFSEGLTSRRVVRVEGTGDDAKEIKTNLGLSASAIEAAKETHLKFSEGTATVDDLVAFTDNVLKGIVEFGEIGSSATPENDGENDVPTSVASVRMAFSEKVNNVLTREGVDAYDKAVSIAGTENPALYKAYLEKSPVVAAQ